MGFRKQPKQYLLKFEDDEYAGFECLMSSLSVDEFIEITTLATKLQGQDAGADDVERLFGIMADKIIEWNLEDEDDNPIPHDPAGLRSQEFGFVMDIQIAWMTAMASVPGPLPNGSNNGANTQEAITQSLANLSRNLPS